MLTLFAALGAGIGFGVGSALVPVLNAEVFAVASGRSGPFVAVAAVLGLALGQTCGKLVLFEAARRGTGRFRAKHDSPRWAERIRGQLKRRRTRVPLVLAAATVGVPPLAGVSLAAGATDEPRREFVLLCLAGRLVRFTALAAPLVWSAR